MASAFSECCQVGRVEERGDSLRVVVYTAVATGSQHARLPQENVKSVRKCAGMSMNRPTPRRLMTSAPQRRR